MSKSFWGIALMGLVFVVFVRLKLVGTGVVASWSWWWVTSPLWLPLTIIGAIVVIRAIVVIVRGIGVIVRVNKLTDGRYYDR